MSILDIQRRFHEVGRIRAGAKSERGAPSKLDKWRLTSANRAALDAAADVYGGTVREWAGAPTPGQWELFTEADTLETVIPPRAEPYSLWYESWTGGGCDRRCDGEQDSISGGPCRCNPDARACKPTLRVSVMLTQVPGLGVWRFESHGWNAAAELPTMLDLLAFGAEGGQFVPAVLRLEQRVSKKGGETRRFCVPVIDIGYTPGTFTQTISAGAATAPLELPSAPAIADPLQIEMGAAITGPVDELATFEDHSAVNAAAKKAGVPQVMIARVYSRLVGKHQTLMGALKTSEVDRLIATLEKVGANLPAAEAKLVAWEALQ